MWVSTFLKKLIAHKISSEEMMAPTRIVLCLVILFFCESLGNGDGRHQEAVQQSAQPRSVGLQKLLESQNISPYEIETYIKESAESEAEFVDFKPLWERLQIPRDEEGIFDGFKPSFNRWEIELTDIPDGNHQVSRVLVKIMVYGGAYRRFLSFKKDPASSLTEWAFTGFFDLSYCRENPDAQFFQKILSNEEGTWLILRDGGSYGTGGWSEYEMWYKVDEDLPYEALQYQIDGARVMGNRSDLKYKSRSRTHEDSEQGLSQEVDYQVFFGTAYKSDWPWLFKKNCRVFFHWDKNSGKFVFDSDNSSISQEELNREFGSYDEENFVKYNFERLIKSARAETPEQREWLKWLVDKLSDNSQKFRLQSALLN